MAIRTCPACSAQWNVGHTGPRFLCPACTPKHKGECAAAVIQVNLAINRGDLPRAIKLMCVDCDKQASVYDHRDYTKPMEIEPVCRACNMKRGPGFNSFFRPAQEALQSIQSSGMRADPPLSLSSIGG